MMKHADVIEQLTLEEKAALLGGHGEWDSWAIPRLNIPAMIMSDGPHGIRRQAGAGDHLGLNASLPATCFPTAATMANSWNQALGEEVGHALGEEAKALGVNILLGPGMNIKRSPLCGRNFEYFSEDPYLAGKMAASYARGIQAEGVYSCIKHFAVNSQEERRMAMNAVVDERTLREIYLTGFEIAVKEGPAKAIMTSYNMVNGVYANESEHLLKDILRGDDWGFDGVVITDWGGSNDHIAGVKAGSDLEMPAPGLDSARQLIEAVKNGTLSEDVINQRVDELLDAVLTTTKAAEGHADTFDVEGHHALARRAAAECAVLLKNEEHILPLKPGTKAAIVGDFAFDPRYQGAGSSVVNTTKLDTMENILKEEAGLTITGMGRGYKRNGDPDNQLKNEAIDLAKAADVVLYFFGLDEMSESEGLDRRHMRIPQVQIDLLQEMKAVNPNIIGILSGGSSIEMPWEKNLKAILHMYLSGQAGAGACADLLMGRANPCGKLAETYPLKHEDTPAFPYFPAKELNSEYRENIYIGYRYFDSAKLEVRYPFGYGLSYTDFEYSGLKVEGDEVSFTIRNTGNVDGSEVAQVYVSLPDAKVFRADKELKGFAKVFIPAGGSEKVTVKLDDKAFRYWNVKTNKWEIEGGTYKIMVGASSRDIRLSEDLTVEGTGAENPYNPADLPAMYSADVHNVSDAEYEKILGTPIPDGSWGSLLNENSAICQLKNSRLGLGRLVYRVLEGKRVKAEQIGKPDLNILFIYNMPFRAIAKMTGGAVSKDMVDGMVTAVNGHFFKGAGKIIGGYFRNGKANKKYAKLLEEDK